MPRAAAGRAAIRRSNGGSWYKEAAALLLSTADGESTRRRRLFSLSPRLSPWGRSYEVGVAGESAKQKNRGRKFRNHGI